jgi:hypothetical protein
MRSHLLKLNDSGNIGVRTSIPGYFFTALLALFAFSNQIYAQGAWTPVANLAPATNLGGMLLLSDGTVLCKSSAGGGDGIGNTYNRLTPDANGSYVNGTWTSIAPMNKTRLYYSSQVLKDARVYVCGGEYGTGGSYGETYNPLTNTWTMAPNVGEFVSDANSEIMEDGRVLQAIVQGNPFLRENKFYNPANNTYGAAPSCIGFHNESTWLKLADNSILMVDRGTRNSERYIPSLNTWVADATLPSDLYDACGLEFGTAVLLPDGRSYWVGATGKTAIYTPSGNNTPGSWAAAADLPNSQGQPDAPGALMVDGNILLATSPKPVNCNVFQSPTSYYVYDYVANSYTRINGPNGLTDNVPCYYAGMVCLPNGQILYSLQNSNRYWVFTPSGAQINANRPVIKKIEKITNKKYRIIGTGFNGNSEGAIYGDDWQMNTNYPIVSAVGSTGKVSYARTFDWNSTGVMRGNKPDTAYLTPPAGLQHGTYSVYVSANGIKSDAFVVNVTPSGIDANSSDLQATSIVAVNRMKIYPNPVKDQTSIMFTLDKTSHVSLSLLDLSGKQLRALFNGNLQQGDHSMQFSFSNLNSGIYTVRKTTENGTENIKLVIE